MSFVSIVKEELLINKKKKVLLAYSHGDLSRNNMFVFNNESLAIDWEHSKFRPVLFDLFFVLIIVRMNCFKINSFSEYTCEIENSIRLVEAYNAEFVNPCVANYKMYVNLFYLEYMAWKINKNLFYINETEANERLEGILKHIEYMKLCEPYMLSAFENIPKARS